jgi:two-component system response regulator DesR
MRGGLLRGALRYVLSSQDDIDVVAERDNLADAIAAVRVQRPEVTVLDLDIADGSGTPAVDPGLFDCKLLVLIDPRRPAVLHSGLTNPPATVGLLAQTVPPERVLDGIRRLVRDERVLDAELVVAALRTKCPLTARELRVLQAVALGLPVKEIASSLGLSPGTVRNHLSRIIAKTGARTRIEAIHIARQAGWL